jgi:hypothetical protein
MEAGLRLAYGGSKNGKFMYTRLNVVRFSTISSNFCGKVKIFMIFFVFFGNKRHFCVYARVELHGTEPAHLHANGTGGLR